MALTSLAASSLGCVFVVIEPVADVVGSVVASGDSRANEAAKVEGTIVVTVGIIVAVAISMLAYFSYINSSNSFSIYFN